MADDGPKNEIARTRDGSIDGLDVSRDGARDGARDGGAGSENVPGDLGLHDTINADSSGRVARTLAEIAPPGPEHAPVDPARGEAWGRYIVLDKLGEGAMGAVYTAYDPQLDRRVALKVLHPNRQVRDREAAKARMVREAKSMARLSHPNVIQVFDVGTLKDDVYITMEYVAGESLASWERDRPWSEVLDAYLQAARGLLHAHQAEVVHRDFKPDNCLVGDDGRVRVIDFGIAQHEPAPVKSAIEASYLNDDHDTARTRAGTILGTPAYMSREQLEGHAADARSDQFAFCVSIYEALYKRRPFEGTTLMQIINEVVQGRIKEIPKDKDVPLWLGPVILKGMQRDSESRYPSMAELIEALTPPVERRRNYAWVGVGLASVVAVTGLGYWAETSAPNRAGQFCQGLEENLEGVWDDERRSALELALTSSDASYAATTLARVTGALDEHAESWLSMRTDACRATRVRGEQTEAVLSLRMACLDRRLRELNSTVDVLSRGDVATRVHAVNVVSDLSSLEPCADVDRLEAEAAREPPEELRERVVEVRARLLEVRPLTHAADYAGALALATTLLGEARELDWEALVAEALVARALPRMLAGEFAETREDLFEAARRADAAGDHATEARAWSLLVFVVGVKMRRPDEGLRWAEFARSTLATLGDDPLEWGQLHYHVGLVLYQQGHHQRALDAFDESDRRYHEVLPPDDYRFPMSRAMAANALSQMGRAEEAIAMHRAALEATRSVFGEGHPRIAPMLNNLATALRRDQRFDEARAALEEALALKRRTLGEDHPSVAVTLSNLGMLEQRSGNFEQAALRLAEARELRGRALGENHARYAMSLTYEAELALDRQRLDESINIYDRALGLQLAIGVPIAIANTQTDLAFAHLVNGEPRRAEALARTALDALLAEGVEPHVIAAARTYLALAMNRLSRSDEALVLAEPALAATETSTTDPDALARSRLALGEALVASGQDPTRGRALIEAALGEFMSAAPREWWGVAQARAQLGIAEEP